jgi:glycosyltransferase involved in cell wall biosynthesis
MESPDTPLVSVLMITYNHERYLRQAIESVMAQKTTFAFELVIGEDCSTDGTFAIVSEFAGRYPDKIRAIRRERNLGAHRNFIETLRGCRGRFVALLEGDDYWTVDDKLARQALVLQALPECAICFARARVVQEDGSQPPWDYPMWNRSRYTAGALMEENFVPTCTAVFRQGLLLEIPNWFYGVTFGDWALHLLLAQCGDLYFLRETMAVYRVHSMGIWSRFDQGQKTRLRDEFRAKLGEYLPDLAGDGEHDSGADDGS